MSIRLTLDCLSYRADSSAVGPDHVPLTAQIVRDRCRPDAPDAPRELRPRPQGLRTPYPNIGIEDFGPSSSRHCSHPSCRGLGHERGCARSPPACTTPLDAVLSWEYDIDGALRQECVGLKATPKRSANASRFLSAVQSCASGVRRTDASNATSMAPQPES
jgi:hypothetical protein